MRQIIFLAIAAGVTAATPSHRASAATPLAPLAPLGEAPVDAALQVDDDSRAVVPLDYPMLRAHAPESLWIDTALDLALIHRGTPYLWGGDDLKTGIDCSHFTRRIYEMAGTGYQAMMTTSDLRDLKNGNGLHRVTVGEARPGDLLVYGYYDAEQKWHGHVVVLVDADFEYGGHRGLVVGSHGEVGIQFVTYAGFPDYWRDPSMALRNVLRIETP